MPTDRTATTEPSTTVRTHAPSAADHAAPHRPAERPADSLWIRVGPDEPGAAGPAVAAIEAELERIDLAVEATGAGATGEETAVQQVVDRYERLLDDRDTAVVDDGPRPAPAGGLLVAAAELVGAVAGLLRR